MGGCRLDSRVSERTEQAISKQIIFLIPRIKRITIFPFREQTLLSNRYGGRSPAIPEPRRRASNRNTFRAMKEELETSMSSKSTEIMDSIESNKTGEKVLVTLYCSDATDALSYPVCFPIEMGSEYLLPELYGKDRDFLGWTKEKDADEKAEILKPGELITVDGSVSLYAKWNMVPTPTATPTPTPSPVPTPEEPSASSEEESDDVDVSESTPMPASVPAP